MGEMFGFSLFTKKSETKKFHQKQHPDIKLLWVESKQNLAKGQLESHKSTPYYCHTCDESITCIAVIVSKKYFVLRSRFRKISTLVGRIYSFLQWCKIHTLTRKLSSRMRTARLSIVVFGRGCVCPGSWGCLWGVSRGVHAPDPEAHPPWTEGMTHAC